MSTRPAFVLLLVCGLLTGQGLSLWHGIAHAGWAVHASDAHGAHAAAPDGHGADAHGSHDHEPAGRELAGHGPSGWTSEAHDTGAAVADGTHPDTAVARCSIPDGAVPGAALPPYRLSTPSARRGAPERVTVPFRPLPSRVVGGGQARAPPIPV